MADDPSLISEFAFVVTSRTRDSGVALADDIATHMLDKLGGEPWLMVDDDWKKLWPQDKFTVLDDQGAMYSGQRRYVFKGPFVGTHDLQEHDGFRTQNHSGDKT